MSLRRKHKKKYRKELGVDEKLTFFAIKVVGVTTLFFFSALAIDTFRVVHKIFH